MRPFSANVVHSSKKAFEKPPGTEISKLHATGASEILVDTTRKAGTHIDNSNTNAFCPICGYPVVKPAWNFCPGCGQALSWSARIRIHSDGACAAPMWNQLLHVRQLPLIHFCILMESGWYNHTSPAAMRIEKHMYRQTLY